MFNETFILKFLKFGVVGFSGLFVDFGTTWLLKDVFKIKKYIANSVGFTCAATSNYILNRVWTFSNTNPAVIVQYSKFLAIAIIGLAMNNLIIYLLTDRRYKLNFYLSKGIATVIVFIWNFFMNYLFTF
jgi:putative flippase GtrA